MMALMIPSRTITRYVLRLFVIRLLVIQVMLVLVLQTLDLLGVSNAISAHHAPAGAALLDYVFLRLPGLAVLFLPFSVLLAALATMVRLASTSELVSMTVSGITRMQVALPMMAAAFVAGLLQLWVNESVALPSQVRLTVWQAADYAHAPPARVTPDPKIWFEQNGQIVEGNVAAKSTGSIRLGNMQIIESTRDDRISKISFANQGVWAGGVLDILPQRAIAYNPEHHVAVPIRLAMKTAAATILNRSISAKSISLGGAMKALRDSPQEAALRPDLQARVLHAFSMPLYVALLPMVAAGIVRGTSRGRKILMSAAVGLGVGFLIFVLDSVMYSVGTLGTVSPPLAVWGTILAIFFGTTGLVLHADDRS
jgi:lipopolysaccharide export system permease protein